MPPALFSSKNELPLYILQKFGFVSRNRKFFQNFFCQGVQTVQTVQVGKKFSGDVERVGICRWSPTRIEG